MVRWERLQALGLVCMGLVGACLDPTVDPGPAADGTGEPTPQPSTSATDAATDDLDDDSGGPGEPGECSASSTCVDAPPEGWQGPVARAEDDIGITLPNCLAPYSEQALEVFDGLLAPPARCGACSCGPALDVECSMPGVHLFDSQDCASNGPTTEPVLLDPSGACVPLNGALGSAGVEIDPVTTVPGTGACAAYDEPFVAPPIEWSQHLRACAPQAPLPACGAHGVCAPTPGLVLDAALCIYRAGEHECPAGPYAARTVWHADARDTRSCTACTCGPPQGQGSCSAEVVLSSTATCDDDYVHITALGSGQCTALPEGPPGSAHLQVTTIDNLGCATEGDSEPQGQVTPADPVTLCCSG